MCLWNVCIVLFCWQTQCDVKCDIGTFRQKKMNVSIWSQLILFHTDVFAFSGGADGQFMMKLTINEWIHRYQSRDLININSYWLFKLPIETCSHKISHINETKFTVWDLRPIHAHYSLTGWTFTVILYRHGYLLVGLVKHIVMFTNNPYYNGQIININVVTWFPPVKKYDT